MSSNHSLFGCSFKGKATVAFASLADLITATHAAWNEIPKETPFGKVLTEHVGKPLTDLLNSCDKSYQVNYVNKPGTEEFSLFSNVFLKTYLVKHVQGGNLFLYKAPLLVLLRGLLAKLRMARIFVFKNKLQGTYTLELLASLDEILALLPTQVQKEITKTYVNRPTNRRPLDDDDDQSDDGEEDVDDADVVDDTVEADDADGDDQETRQTDVSPSEQVTRVIKIWVEPFIQTMSDAFRLAANEQRHANAQRPRKPTEKKVYTGHKSQPSDKFQKTQQSKQQWQQVNRKGRPQPE